jgi:dTDP-4-amino-4,6-dideoxygalactose transaminase
LIRLSKSSISFKEIFAVSKVLKKEYLGMGEEVKQFENKLTNFFGRQSLCVNSGTAALQLSLQSIGVGPGDEVLIQSLTYVASFQAISATGAKPIACEVNPLDLTIDLNDAQKKITSKTKAIMPMHYSGNPGNLESIYNFANKNKLRVIEDAAHAFGSSYKDRLIGSFGDIVCFSFDGIKNITSGEGGAIVSSDTKIMNKIKDFRLLGVINDSENRALNKRSWGFDVTDQGWRYHMSNVMAAIGIVQFKKFKKFSSKRKSLAKLYQKELNNLKNVELLDIDYSNITPHIFVVKIKNNLRNHLKDVLKSAKIQTGLHYKPNHLLSYYSQKKMPLTELIYSELITLPLHADLKNSDVKRICSIIKPICE